MRPVGTSARPPSGAAIEVTAFHQARAAHKQRLELTADEATPGHYSAPIRIQQAGRWRFGLKATRGDDVFTMELEEFLTLRGR